MKRSEAQGFPGSGRMTGPVELVAEVLPAVDVEPQGEHPGDLEIVAEVTSNEGGGPFPLIWRDALKAQQSDSPRLLWDGRSLMVGKLVQYGRWVSYGIGIVNPILYAEVEVPEVRR